MSELRQPNYFNVPTYSLYQGYAETLIDRGFGPNLPLSIEGKRRVITVTQREDLDLLAQGDSVAILGELNQRHFQGRGEVLYYFCPQGSAFVLHSDAQRKATSPMIAIGVVHDISKYKEGRTDTQTHVGVASSVAGFNWQGMEQIFADIQDATRTPNLLSLARASKRIINWGMDKTQARAVLRNNLRYYGDSISSHVNTWLFQQRETERRKLEAVRVQQARIAQEERQRLEKLAAETLRAAQQTVSPAPLSPIESSHGSSLNDRDEQTRRQQIAMEGARRAQDVPYEIWWRGAHPNAIGGPSEFDKSSARINDVANPQRILDRALDPLGLRGPRGLDGSTGPFGNPFGGGGLGGF